MSRGSAGDGVVCIKGQGNSCGRESNGRGNNARKSASGRSFNLMSTHLYACLCLSQAVLEIIKLSGAKLSKSEKPETLRKLDKVRRGARGCGDGVRAR